MNTVTIRTNKHRRQFNYRHEVPAKVLVNNFDWLNEEDSLDGWIYYHRRWYHISEFMIPTSTGCPFDDEFWQGHISDSFFSGVLLHVSDDCETYQIATYSAEMT